MPCLIIGCSRYRGEALIFRVYCKINLTVGYMEGKGNSITLKWSRKENDHVNVMIYVSAATGEQVKMKSEQRVKKELQLMSTLDVVVSVRAVKGCLRCVTVLKDVSHHCSLLLLIPIYRNKMHIVRTVIK